MIYELYIVTTYDNFITLMRRSIRPSTRPCTCSTIISLSLDLTSLIHGNLKVTFLIPGSLRAGTLLFTEITFYLLAIG